MEWEMLLRRVLDARSTHHGWPTTGPCSMGTVLRFCMDFRYDSRSDGHFLSELSPRTSAIDGSRGLVFKQLRALHSPC
jgi:hypothetical protein